MLCSLNFRLTNSVTEQLTASQKFLMQLFKPFGRHQVQSSRLLLGASVTHKKAESSVTLLFNNEEEMEHRYMRQPLEFVWHLSLVLFLSFDYGVHFQYTFWGII